MCLILHTFLAMGNFTLHLHRKIITTNDCTATKKNSRKFFLKNLPRQISLPKDSNTFLGCETIVADGRGRLEQRTAPLCYLAEKEILLGNKEDVCKLFANLHKIKKQLQILILFHINQPSGYFFPVPIFMYGHGCTKG